MNVRRLLRDCAGASAAEFALVLPLLLLLMFGIIDVGRYMWSVNRAEKAAHMGVRMAVVTDHVSSTIGDSFVGQCSTPLGQGDTIPADCFTQITCTKTGANATCTSGTADTDAFDRVIDRMEVFMPEIEDSNVSIIYSPSGLGYAGDPNGPDVAPLVTVQLSNLSFHPTVLLTLASFDLPNVHSSLTFEDGQGAISN
jgi:Flp pilus assembly protein TadG